MSPSNGIQHAALLPRISLQPNDTQIEIPFTRRQFPISLSFAMTINKSQGQTLKQVGIFLPETVFGHGQLYVALSRATHPDNVKVFIQETNNQGTFQEIDGVYTENIVYTEMLQAAGIATHSNEVDNCNGGNVFSFIYPDNYDIYNDESEIFD